MNWSLAKIARVTAGELLNGDPARTVEGVCIDSRQLKGGELFFALPGQRRDGHEFVMAAAAAGAAGVVVSRRVELLPEGVGVIRVADTVRALQELAAAYRNELPVRVIAVTGSSGKTTTKDLVAAVLAVNKRVLKTEGNYNNELGVPLMLLRLKPEHEIAVLELAMRGKGEIAFLSRLVQPEIGIITNIGVAHLERLGSVLAIARAKGELLEYIPTHGLALIHGDSPYAREQARRCAAPVLFFGLSEGNDIKARELRSMAEGSEFLLVYQGEKRRLHLPLPGRHNVVNALPAIACGRYFGLSYDEIEAGLKQVRLTAMRQEIFITRSGCLVINDAYNANPLSMQSALDLLSEVAGRRRRIAVLGDMLELGPASVEWHRQVGKYVVGRADLLVTVGDRATDIAVGAVANGFPPRHVFSCLEHETAVAFLRHTVGENDAVLLKGSRGMQMEKIITRLQEEGLWVKAGPENE